MDKIGWVLVLFGAGFGLMVIAGVIGRFTRVERPPGLLGASWKNGDAAQKAEIAVGSLGGLVMLAGAIVFFWPAAQ
jgi:hypothetical protein